MSTSGILPSSDPIDTNACCWSNASCSFVAACAKLTPVKLDIWVCNVVLCAVASVTRLFAVWRLMPRLPRDVAMLVSAVCNWGSAAETAA
jgi:hypothetical protein